MRRKSINLFVIFIIIVIAVLAKIFIFYDKYKMPEGALIELNEDSIEVYSNINNYDLIKNSNVEIISENVKLNTSVIGEYTETIKYKYKSKFKTYLYDINYKIEDSIEPIFVYGMTTSKSFFVNEGNNEKLLEKITYADNYDITPTLKIEGNVDFAEVGKYTVTYVLTDSSNNETRKKCDITIKEKPVPKENNSSSKEEKENKKDEEVEEKGTKIADYIEKYKTDKTMIGIDVSKWQGEIDFEKVKDSGVEFVILRMGVMKDKTTPLAIDKTYEENFKNAKKAGLKVGVYVYSESDSVESAKENAEFVIQNLKGEKLDFPVVFDWESWSYFNSMGINLHMLNEMYEAFSEEMDKAGYKTMLYASENYLNNVWLDVENYDIWVAKYSSKMPSLNNDKEFILWQTTDDGKVDGIKEYVDLDVFYK